MNFSGPALAGCAKFLVERARDRVALVAPPGAHGGQPHRQHGLDAQAAAPAGGLDAGGVQQPAHAGQMGGQQQQLGGRVEGKVAQQPQHAGALRLQRVDACHHQTEQPVAHAARLGQRVMGHRGERRLVRQAAEAQQHVVARGEAAARVHQVQPGRPGRGRHGQLRPAELRHMPEGGSDQKPVERGVVHAGGLQALPPLVSRPVRENGGWRPPPRQTGRPARPPPASAPSAPPRWCRSGW